MAGPEQPLIDEIALGERPDLADPPAVAVFDVQRPGARSCAPTRPPGSLLMAGDAEGMVDAAGVGLIKPAPGQLLLGLLRRPTRPASTRIYGDDADLMVTDTNRKRAERWGTIREQFGYTERAGEVAPYDPTDQRLEVFPDAGDDRPTP